MTAISDTPAGNLESGMARPPSVERVLRIVRERLDRPHGHDAMVGAVREALASERARLADGAAASSVEALASAALERLRFVPRGPDRLINATGVILHTNLGRAPWPRAAIEAAVAAAGQPLFLELDRSTGRRGRRYRQTEDDLVALTGAEDALVTNNNAAAVTLATHLAGRGGGVAVARGELVEIGGGVRIPEIIRRAGARLVEVGTTNKTRPDDFEEPLASGRARVVLRVHPSNFRLSGFTEAPDPGDVASVAHRHGAVVVDDLGSGALLDTSAFGLAHEPMPAERLAAGADLVTFSGDKLLGGPQAGLIVGRADLIARIRRDPLARAMRPDKVTLAALAATLGLYRAGLAIAEIPAWRMIATPVDELRRRAEQLADAQQPAPAEQAGGRALGRVVELTATVGGGSLPGETLPSFGLALDTPSPDRLVAALRRGKPAVVARIERGAVVVDLRTVDPADDARLATALSAALAAAAT